MCKWAGDETVLGGVHGIPASVLVVLVLGFVSYACSWAWTWLP